MATFFHCSLKLETEAIKVLILVNSELKTNPDFGYTSLTPFLLTQFSLIISLSCCAAQPFTNLLK